VTGKRGARRKGQLGATRKRGRTVRRKVVREIAAAAMPVATLPVRELVPKDQRPVKSDGMPVRGPDLYPRRQVVRAIVLRALTKAQSRGSWCGSQAPCCRTW